jgi:hypothetical protein
MKANPLVLGSLFIVVCLLSACSTTYAPESRVADPKLVPNLRSGKRIALVNSQPSTEIVLVGDAGMGQKVSANLHVWTDNAILGIGKSLEKKGVVIDPHAEKALKIAVTRAAFGEAGGGWAFRASIDFTVETSDGHVATLTAEERSWKFLKACDAAMEKIPLVTLTDPGVVKFLNEP